MFLTLNSSNFYINYAFYIFDLYYRIGVGYVDSRSNYLTNYLI